MGSTLQPKLDLLNKSKERVKAMKFGDPVTNVCAGDRNPRRHSYFVEYKVKSHKNRFGVIHKYYSARCTDGKGKFWNGGLEVTFPGHLSYEESKEIYAPIHAIEFGK